MELDEQYLADTRFFDLVDLGELFPEGTLESASGMKADPGPYATALIEAVERAWRTPFGQVTCEQVRVLLGQKLGLQWLAEPILRFVARYPSATITNYPGEMALLALQASPEFLAFAPQAFRDWLRGDFEWMDETFGCSRQLRLEAEAALSGAHRLAAMP